MSMADLDSQGGIVNPPRESEYYAPEIETMPREKLEKLLPIGVLCQIKSNGHNVYARFNPGVLPAYFLPPRYIC